MRRQKNEQERKDIIENLMDIFEIAEIDTNIMQLALFSIVSDYEGAVRYISAEKENVDFIITGDEKFKSHDLAIPRISAEQFLNVINSKG